MCFCHCVDPRTRCQVRWHPMGAGLGERRRVRERERSEQTAWGEEATERDRMMDEFGEEKHWEVGKEINSGLSFDYCQKIYTHLLPFDAKEDARLFLLRNLFWSLQQRCPLSGPPIDSLCTDASQGSACVCKEGKWGVDHVTGSAVSENGETRHSFIFCTSGWEGRRNSDMWLL